MKKMSIKVACFYTAIALTFVTQSYGQVPHIEWQKPIGGTAGCEAMAVKQTSDGGYISAGNSEANPYIHDNHGGSDFWVVKMSAYGITEWQVSLGGSNNDDARAIEQTSDGGYIVAGSASSADGEVTGNHGFEDCWIVKLDNTGTIQWQKSIGGSNYDVANAIHQTTDGGYIIAGTSYSADDDVPANHGSSDYYIVKLDATGAIEWKKSYGGSGDDVALSVIQAYDHGYVVAGYSNSTNGDVANHHGNFNDCWILKLTTTGNIEWQKSLGGTNDDYAYSVIQSSDSSFVLACTTDSYDGDVTINHGGLDCWIVKLNASGSILWQKSYGSSTGDDYANSISETADHGYIFAGNSSGYDGDLTTNHGSFDVWVVKINGAGSLEWQKSIGGPGDDVANMVEQTADGGYVMAGRANGNGGDISGELACWNYWILKIGNNISTKTNSVGIMSLITLKPNPTTGEIMINGAGNAGVKVLSVTGQLIKDYGHTETISIADLPAGMYLVQLFGEQGAMEYSEKVIKQ